MKLKIALLPISACLLLSSSVAFAQDGYQPHADSQDQKSGQFDRSEKKQRSIFHRPKKKTAAEQFKLAQHLEAKKHFRSARDAYNDLVHSWHTAPEAPLAQLALAKNLFAHRKYEKAFNAFQYLIDYYSGHFKYNEVLDYQLKIANQIMNDRWGDVFFLPGFESPEKALPLLSKLIANAPNWGKTATVRLSIGMIHEELKDFESAVIAYESVEQHHAKSDEAEQASFRKASCLFTLSEKTPRDEKRCRAAMSALASFLANHKQSDKQTEVEQNLEVLQKRLATMYYERALFYDTISKRPASALIAYRDFLKKFPASERAQEVYTRMEVLELQVKESSK